MMKTVMVVKCWIKTKLRENTIKTWASTDMELGHIL